MLCPNCAKEIETADAHKASTDVSFSPIAYDLEEAVRRVRNAVRDRETRVPLDRDDIRGAVCRVDDALAALRGFLGDGYICAPTDWPTEIEKRDALYAESQRQLDEVSTRFKSLLVELWDGVRAHELWAPSQGRDGERLIHAYCGGIVKARAERDEAQRQLQALQEECAAAVEQTKEREAEAAAMRDKAERLEHQEAVALGHLGVANNLVDAYVRERDELRARVGELEQEVTHAKAAIDRAEKNGDWAAIYNWLDKNKDAVTRKISDHNGELERQVAALEKKLAESEAGAATIECELRNCEASLAAAACSPFAIDGATYNSVIARLDTVIRNRASAGRALLESHARELAEERAKRVAAETERDRLDNIMRQGPRDFLGLGERLLSAKWKAKRNGGEMDIGDIVLVVRDWLAAPPPPPVTEEPACSNCLGMGWINRADLYATPVKCRKCKGADSPAPTAKEPK